MASSPTVKDSSSGSSSEESPTPPLLPTAGTSRPYSRSEPETEFRPGDLLSGSDSRAPTSEPRPKSIPNETPVLRPVTLSDHEKAHSAPTSEPRPKPLPNETPVLRPVTLSDHEKAHSAPTSEPRPKSFPNKTPVLRPVTLSDHEQAHINEHRHHDDKITGEATGSDGHVGEQGGGSRLRSRKDKLSALAPAATSRVHAPARKRGHAVPRNQARRQPPPPNVWAFIITEVVAPVYAFFCTPLFWTWTLLCAAANGFSARASWAIDVLDLPGFVDYIVYPVLRFFVRAPVQAFQAVGGLICKILDFGYIFVPSRRLMRRSLVWVLRAELMILVMLVLWAVLPVVWDGMLRLYWLVSGLGRPICFALVGGRKLVSEWLGVDVLAWALAAGAWGSRLLADAGRLVPWHEGGWGIDVNVGVYLGLKMNGMPALCNVPLLKAALPHCRPAALDSANPEDIQPPAYTDPFSHILQEQDGFIDVFNSGYELLPIADTLEISSLWVHDGAKKVRLGELEMREDLGRLYRDLSNREEDTAQKLRWFFWRRKFALFNMHCDMRFMINVMEQLEELDARPPEIWYLRLWSTTSADRAELRKKLNRAFQTYTKKVLERTSDLHNEAAEGIQDLNDIIHVQLQIQDKLAANKKSLELLRRKHEEVAPHWLQKAVPFSKSHSTWKRQMDNIAERTEELKSLTLPFQVAQILMLEAFKGLETTKAVAKALHDRYPDVVAWRGDGDQRSLLARMVMENEKVEAAEREMIEYEEQVKVHRRKMDHETNMW